MNLTNAKEVKINGKTVKRIKINNNIVYERIQLILSSSNSFVHNTGTVLINLVCERLPNTEIDLYQVVGLTKTKLDTLTTDENGEASYTYTGTGAGEVEFVAEYDGKESNKVTVDDYVPAATDIGILSSSYSVDYGTSITLTATVKDQHNQAMNGQTVTFKEGNTSLGTGTTNSSGIATLTISTLSVGSHTIKAVCGTANSSNITVNVNKLNTSLSIEVPALVYSDVFDVTGILKDSNNTPISGATVKLVWNDGTSHNTTATTNNNGEVTFHRDAPTTITDYSFKLQYEGTANYNASDSSVVSRTVGKETSVLTVSSPVNNQTVLVGSNVSISGTLLDNDGDPIKNKSVLVKKGGSTLTTLTTGNDGSFSGSVSSTGWSVGSTTLSFEFASDTYYTGASQDVSVSVSDRPAPASITLSTDKPIMMKDEIATITATVLDGNGDPCEGETVSFSVVNGESLGSATTDSSGQCNVYYLGKGVGDLNIKAECNLLIQTCDVEDCFGYAPTEQYYSGRDKHFKLLGDCNFPNNVDWELTADLKTSRGFIIVSPFSNGEQTSITQLDKYCGIGQNTVNNLLSALGFTSDIENSIWYTTGTYGTGYRSVKITKVDNTYSFYFDGNLHTTTTSQGFTAYTPLYPYIRIAGSGNAYVKNLKIKPL